MDMVNTEKRKEKQEVQEILNYQELLNYSKRNKCEAKKSMKTTERK